MWSDSPNVRSLTPLGEACDAPPGSGASGRPLVALSLALNYAADGLNPRGYHLVNVLVHVAAALALFALARRVIVLARGPSTQGMAPTLAALAIALPWAAHPLHTMATLNVVYRNESLVGLFFLLTLGAALASFVSRRPALAVAIAIGACLLGTASKEVIVTAPLVVWLFDWVLVSRGPWRALRDHKPLYIALALCWIPLAVFVAGGDRGESVGFGLEGIGPLDYLRTQAGVLPHYLRLILWPHPLVLDYDGWPVAHGWSEVALPGGAVIVALLLSIGLLVRGRLVGAIATSAFLVLAPTSTLIPLSGAVLGEHRTYLVVSAVLALLGIAAARGLARFGLSSEASTNLLAAASLLATLGLGAMTVERQGDYQSELGIWRDTVEKRPDNPRAWSSLGVVYADGGEIEAAQSAYRRALEPGTASLSIADQSGESAPAPGRARAGRRGVRPRGGSAAGLGRAQLLRRHLSNRTRQPTRRHPPPAPGARTRPRCAPARSLPHRTRLGRSPRHATTNCATGRRRCVWRARASMIRRVPVTWTFWRRPWHRTTSSKRRSKCCSPWSSAWGRARTPRSCDCA